MAKSTVPPSSEATANAEGAKAHFAKAIEEAKAGAQTLGKDAQERVGAYAGTYREKVGKAAGEWTEEARARSDEAKDKAFHFANEGKTKASEAIAGLGKLVEENATTIDEKVGAKYGDYARSAARSMQDAAARLDAKELSEIGEDAKEFVRKKPGLAIGIAAAAGFALARLFKRSKSSDTEDTDAEDQA